MTLFNTDPDSEALRSYTQADLLASTLRISLGALGPFGPLIGEFLTQFVPRQRIDRLHEFTEKLNDRLAGLEEQFKERTVTSAAYAALTEQAAVSAVRTASSEQRTDLAELLKHGLSRVDSEMLEEQMLLSLRERLNDAQVLLLMSYGNFRRTMGDPEFKEFMSLHPTLFSLHPPTFGGAEEDRRRWTVVEHYKAELAAIGLLKETEGIARSSRSTRQYEITHLGQLLLQAIGRYRNPYGRE